jgi:hypothetical protein
MNNTDYAHDALFANYSSDMAQLALSYRDLAHNSICANDADYSSDML